MVSSLNTIALGIAARQIAVCGPADNVGGTVYQDINANGVRALANPNEPGVAGVIATAYNATGVAIASTLTAADGTYVLNVPDTTNVRVEFTSLPGSFLSGPFGSDSTTTVTFVQSPNCTIDLGINTPGAHCQDNPDLATNCYVFGNQIGVTMPVIVGFPYSAGGTSLPAIDQPPTHTVLATAGQVGTTWGLAYP